MGKIEILLEENLFNQAKQRAVEEGKPLSRLIHDALAAYVEGGMADARRRETAYRVFYDEPIRLTAAEFREILADDIWASCDLE